MADRIPITAAERIGKDHAYDQVIIYARRVGEQGLEWVTTWGKDRTHCDVAARIGDAIGRHVVKPIEERDAEIDRLRALLRRAGEALEPMSFFVSQFDRRPLRNMGNEFYGIHTGTEFEASLTFSDFRTARTVAREIEEALK